MARKAAQKAAKAAPLDGCSIATSGKFPGTTQGALGERITSLGATVASKVTADTTFLIATEKDYESKSTKVKAAATHNVPVITLDWLDECESTGEHQQHPDTLMNETLTYTKTQRQMRPSTFFHHQQQHRPQFLHLRRRRPMAQRSALPRLTPCSLQLRLNPRRKSPRLSRTPK
jgi:hypothetical protein